MQQMIAHHLFFVDTAAMKEIENSTETTTMEEGSILTLPDPSIVFLDTVEWWSDCLLQQTDLKEWEKLDHLLECVNCFPSRSILADRLRVLEFWYYCLEQLQPGGDFEILQDKWILLKLGDRLTFLKDHPEYVRVLELFKLHEPLSRLYNALKTLNEEKESFDEALQTYQRELISVCGDWASVPFLLKATINVENAYLDDSDCDLVKLVIDRIDTTINGDGVYSYSKLRSQVQSILVSWSEANLGTPKLKQLYRGVSAGDLQALGSVQNPGKKMDEEEETHGGKDPDKEESGEEEANESSSIEQKGMQMDEEEKADGREDPDKEENDEGEGDDSSRVQHEGMQVNEEEHADRRKDPDKEDSNDEGKNDSSSAQQKGIQVSQKEQVEERKESEKEDSNEEEGNDSGVKQNPSARKRVQSDDLSFDDPSGSQKAATPNGQRSSTKAPFEATKNVPLANGTSKEDNTGINEVTAETGPNSNPDPLAPTLSSTSNKKRKSSDNGDDVLRKDKPPVAKIQKRCFWTEDESEALLTGIEKFGYGKWAVIKKNYGERLKRRSNTQLKDRARTLFGQGKRSIQI